MQRWLVLLFTSSMLFSCADDSETDVNAPADVASISDTNTAADVEDTSTSPDTSEPAGPDLSQATFDVRGTLRMVYIWNAPIETEMEVVAADGTPLAVGETDDYGSLVIRDLAPATDLTIRVKGTPENQASRVQVMGEADLEPDPELYASQMLQPGNNYITMRDGTKLHIFVSLPGPIEEGPYPTVVNYSGYSPGRPGQQLSPIVEAFCGDFPVLCDVPAHGAGIFTGLMGYASVGVNMRGTGARWRL